MRRAFNPGGVVALLVLGLLFGGCAQRQTAVAEPAAPSASSWGDASSAAAASAAPSAPAGAVRAQRAQVCVPEFGMCDAPGSACCAGFVCAGIKRGICIPKY